MMIEYTKPDNLSFEVLNKDTLTASVSIKDGEVFVETFTENPLLQPFGMKNVTVAKINEFFESRCFDKNRPDKDELLKEMGVRYYNPVDVVKKTHGRIWDDFTWVRFSGETLTWEDVANGRL